MADKSPGKSPRKPALSIKERRAAKRAKVVESTPMVRKRKRRPDRRFVRRFIKNATQMPITGCYRCGRGRFHGASATGREPVRSSWARMCESRRMYAAATTAHGELLLGRVPVHHAALCGRAAGSGRIDVQQVCG